MAQPRRGIANQGRIAWRAAAAFGLGALVIGAATRSPAAERATEAGDEETWRTRSVEEKLDRILENQQSILQQLDAIREELRVVKIRATR